ncbi:MAG: hypothetical protein RLZZ136_1745 [Pseudomonadota bacterium]|jgi:AraC-like DNA-binding protein
MSEITPLATAHDALAEVSVRLLRSAQGTLRETRGGPSDETPHTLSDFVQVYREWITLERGELGSQQRQADQWQMLVHCMINAPTIHAAIGHLLHFTPVVWGNRAPIALRDDDDVYTLVFNEPFRPGAEGLVAELWMLSLILSTLEFLGGVQFFGASGRVIHDSCLPDGVARLLFGAPVAYGQNDVALLMPRHHLRRPVTARPADLPLFFQQLLPLTLGAARAIPETRAMVAGLIRDHKQGPIYREINRGAVAAMLGLSEATMRRRLKAEGTTFRQIRDKVYNDLAIEWLASADITIGTIASRLSFSDAFAFRRFFSRLNGRSPTYLRNQRSGSDGAGEG